MASIMLNGARCRLARLEEADLKPGTLVREPENRRVYRILCQDGDDLVLRNVRHDNLFDVVPRDKAASTYHLVIP